MVDRLTKERRSENMSRIRSKDMKPEMIVRKLVHGLGYRYRLHNKQLPGKPDLVFSTRKKVIYVHGCFWHQHDSPVCRIKRLPKSNLEYWLPKLERNKLRDDANKEALKKMNWSYLIIWECETKQSDTLKKRIKVFLEN